MYTKNDFMAINRIIRKQIDNLEKIILFGSYATNLANDESDIDIAIITKYEIERKDKLKIIGNLLVSLAKSGYDVDLIIKSNEKFVEMSELNGTLSYAINQQGQEIWTNLKS